MFESFLRKNFWQSLFTGTAGSGRTKYTFEELRALSDVLNKNQVVTEANRALVVETIRSIAEFMIWGDQNEPRIFDYFLENNIMHYLHRVLQQPANRTGDVAKQVLQTLSIIIQNIRSETGTYFLFSNNHINNIVEIRFDFEDEEVLGYYISFLKTISLKLNVRTVQFFFDRREGAYTFPLYSEAVKFAHHKEGMVRAGVRTLTLNVFSVPDEHIQEFVCRPPASAYFAEMVAYIADQIKILDKRMAAAEGFSAQVLSSLDSQLAEVEDMVSYVADILTTAHPRLAHLVAEQLWVSLVGPYLFRPLLEYGSKDVARSNSGARRTSTGGTTPASPGAGGSSPIVRTSCSLYVLERFFVLITYPPLLHNLALALLDPRGGHPSCRSALVSVLRSEDHRAVPAALRCLVAVVNNRRLSPEVLALLCMVPHSRSVDLQAACPAGSCGACQLSEELPPLPPGCSAAGAPPDPLAEEAQPVATVASSTSAATAFAFGYHLLWTRLEGASEWVLAQQGFGMDGRQNAGGDGEPSGDVRAADEDDAEKQLEEDGAQTSAQLQIDLLGSAVHEQRTRAVGALGDGEGVLPSRPQAAPLDSVTAEAGSVEPAEPSTHASDVDLLDLGDEGLADVQPQTVSRQHTGQETDLLAMDDMPGSAVPPPMANAPGVAADTAVPDLIDVQPSVVTTGSATAGPIADLLDLGAEAEGASAAAPTASASLTPSASVGQAPAASASSGSGPPDLLDSLLEPSASGRAVPSPVRVEAETGAPAFTVGTVVGAATAELSAVQPTSSAPRDAVGGTHQAAEPLDNVPASDRGPLLPSGSVSSGTAGTSGFEDPEALNALDARSGPVAPGPQSAASSSVLGSVGGNSFSGATTPSGAPGDESVTPSSVLESSNWGPGRQGAAEAEAEAAAPPPPPPPAAPPPPAPAPAPLLAGPCCAAHARPAVMSASADLLDALFALLSMQLLPIAGLWHVGYLLQQLYPRAQEQRELEEQRQQLANQQQQPADESELVGEAMADLLNIGEGDVGPGTGAVAPGASPSRAVPDELQQAQSPLHPLDPSSTVGWACELTASQREALRVAAVSAASAVLDEVGGMWCDALVAMLVLEWPVAHDAVMRPVLRTGAEQLMAGPHLYPRQNTRGLSHASRNDQNLSGSAVAALHSYHAVARLAALLLVHDLLCKGATERTPPVTVPPAAGPDVEAREWDLLEGQEVELQAGSAIPCIVSFSPGQERRVYFAAAGPALRRVSEYLQNPQAVMADPVSQSVVLHSSPAVILADPAPTRLNAGIVLSVSPLLGCDPHVDKNVAKWLHVHVRPSVRGLLRLLRSAAAGRKGGLMGALKHLVDGHWVLAFPDPERAGNARQLVEQSAHRLRAIYCELLSPVLGTVME